MNEYNAELIRRHFRLECAGDSEAVLAEMVDEPVYRVPGMFDDDVSGKSDVRRVHRGKAAIRRIHEGLNDAFDDLDVRILSLVTTDTEGYAEIDVMGTLKGSFDGVHSPGAHIHLMHVTMFTFADGKIASEAVYYDRRELLRQVGLEARVVRPDAGHQNTA